MLSFGRLRDRFHTSVDFSHGAPLSLKTVIFSALAVTGTLFFLGCSMVGYIFYSYMADTARVSNVCSGDRRFDMSFKSNESRLRLLRECGLTLYDFINAYEYHINSGLDSKGAQRLDMEGIRKESLDMPFFAKEQNYGNGHNEATELESREVLNEFRLSGLLVSANGSVCKRFFKVGKDRMLIEDKERYEDYYGKTREHQARINQKKDALKKASRSLSELMDKQSSQRLSEIFRTTPRNEWVDKIVELVNAALPSNQLTSEKIGAIMVAIRDYDFVVGEFLQKTLISGDDFFVRYSKLFEEIRSKSPNFYKKFVDLSTTSIEAKQNALWGKDLVATFSKFGMCIPDGLEMFHDSGCVNEQKKGSSQDPIGEAIEAGLYQIEPSDVLYDRSPVIEPVGYRGFGSERRNSNMIYGINIDVYHMSLDDDAKKLVENEEIEKCLKHNPLGGNYYISKNRRFEVQEAPGIIKTGKINTVEKAKAVCYILRKFYPEVIDSSLPIDRSKHQDIVCKARQAHRMMFGDPFHLSASSIRNAAGGQEY